MPDNQAELQINLTDGGSLEVLNRMADAIERVSLASEKMMDSLDKTKDRTEKTGEEVDKAAGDFEKLGHLMQAESFHKIAEGFSELAAGAKEFANILGETFEGGAAAIKNAELWGKALSMSADAYSNIASAMTAMEIDGTLVGRSMQQISIGWDKAASGDEKFKSVFKELGIEVKHGSRLMQEDVIKIFDSLQTMDPQHAMRLGRDVGIRNPGQLIPKLQLESRPFSELVKEMDKLGHLTQNQREDFMKAHESAELLGVAYTRLKEKITAGAAPAFNVLNDYLIQLVEEVGKANPAFLAFSKIAIDSIKPAGEMGLALFGIVSASKVILTSLPSLSGGFGMLLKTAINPGTIGLIAFTAALVAVGGMLAVCKVKTDSTTNAVESYNKQLVEAHEKHQISIDDLNRMKIKLEDMPGTWDRFKKYGLDAIWGLAQAGGYLLSVFAGIGGALIDLASYANPMESQKVMMGEKPFMDRAYKYFRGTQKWMWENMNQGYNAVARDSMKDKGVAWKLKQEEEALKKVREAEEKRRKEAEERAKHGAGGSGGGKDGKDAKEIAKDYAKDFVEALVKGLNNHKDYGVKGCARAMSDMLIQAGLMAKNEWTATVAGINDYAAKHSDRFTKIPVGSKLDASKTYLVADKGGHYASHAYAIIKGKEVGQDHTGNIREGHSISGKGWANVLANMNVYEVSSKLRTPGEAFSSQAEAETAQADALKKTAEQQVKIAENKVKEMKDLMDAAKIRKDETETEIYRVELESAREQLKQAQDFANTFLDELGLSALGADKAAEVKKEAEEKRKEMLNSIDNKITLLKSQQEMLRMQGKDFDADVLGRELAQLDFQKNGLGDMDPIVAKAKYDEELAKVEKSISDRKKAKQEEQLRKDADVAKANLEKSKLLGEGMIKQKEAADLVMSSLEKLRQYYLSVGKSVEALNTQLEILRMKQDKKSMTFGQEFLMAGGTTGDLTSFLEQRFSSVGMKGFRNYDLSGIDKSKNKELRDALAKDITKTLQTVFDITQVNAGNSDIAATRDKLRQGVLSLVRECVGQ